MSDPNVIGVFGDWHGDAQWARLAFSSAARKNASTLLHVGDFPLDWPGRGRGRFEDRLNRFLAANGQTLIVSPGNHDCIERIDRLNIEGDGLITWRSNIKVLPKGGRTVIGGLTVAGLGGAYSVDREFRTEGKDLFSDEEPTAAQAEQLIAGGPVDILITHDAPLGVPVESGFDLPPDIVERADRTRILLRDVVERLQPRHVFCGHWHQRVTHEIRHPGGVVSRVDLLDMQGSKEGNGVLVWTGPAPLRIEPLLIQGNP